MWYERNVMLSVYVIKSCKKPMRFECSGRVTDGFPRIKKFG